MFCTKITHFVKMQLFTKKGKEKKKYSEQEREKRGGNYA